jgi:hypothetical protein
MSLVRTFILSTLFLLVHALLCSALSIDLPATSAFPSKPLMFTSDDCIFPVVERLSSPSVYPVLSLLYGFHPAPSGAKRYKTRHKINLFLRFVVSSVHFDCPPCPGTCIITISLASTPRFIHLCTTNETNPLSLSWIVSELTRPFLSTTFPLSIYQPTVAVTSFLSHFPYSCLLLSCLVLFELQFSIFKFQVST